MCSIDMIILKISVLTSTTNFYFLKYSFLDKLIKIASERTPVLNTTFRKQLDAQT